MPNRLISRQRVPFAEEGENTFGLAVIKEVWETECGQKTYWKYDLPDAVQIFALTTDGQLIAILEFQPGVGTEYLHLPGEMMKEGETPLDAATRGLLEETGYEAGPAKLLSVILENSARSDRAIHIVFIKDCKKSQRENEVGIKTVLLSPRDFWSHLMQYFTTSPSHKHGAGAALKASVLAFQELGLFGF